MTMKTRQNKLKEEEKRLMRSGGESHTQLSESEQNVK